MTNLSKITEHRFFKSLFEDCRLLISTQDSKSPNSKSQVSEYEFYILNTGFFCSHFIELCQQLENAVELLSNFRYDTKSKISRSDHLTYNVENYIIRLTSMSDRILQIINATFHLGTDGKDVSERVILNNLNISQTNLTNYYKKFKNQLEYYKGTRNTIVHRHSLYEEKDLNNIQLLYHKVLSEQILDRDDKGGVLKDGRKIALTKYIAKKKKQFETTNENCFSAVLPILDILAEHYERMKRKLN